MSRNLQSEEYIKKKRNRRLKKLGLGAAAFVIVMGILAGIAHIQKIRISKIELAGGVLVTQPDVQKETLSYLSGSYLWVYPKNNAFLYPRLKLAADLKDKFKRIDKIAVTLKNPQTLSVQITERKPQALWCDTVPDGTPSHVEHCYFMDMNSTIYTEAPDFSGDAYFKYYGPLAVDTSPLGQDYIASSTQYAALTQFVERIKSMSLHPQYLISKGDGEYVLVVAGGGQIYFNSQEPFMTVADNLETLLRTPALATSTKNNLPVQYIDLRFGNKLFYKLK